MNVVAFTRWISGHRICATRFEEISLSYTTSTRGHGLSHRFHPSQLRVVGLTAALETLRGQLSTDEVSVVFWHDTVPITLSKEVIVCLYRVAQEH